MSRIGQYIVEQEEVKEDVTVADVDNLFNDIIDDFTSKFKPTADCHSVADVLHLADGIETFGPMPVFEEEDELLLSLGTEDFSDHVDRLWQKIKRWIKELLTWLDQTLDTAAISLALLKQIILQTQFDLNKPGDRENSLKPLVLTRHVNALSVRYRPLHDIGRVTSALEILQSTTNKYYTYVNRDLKGNLSNALSLLTERRATDPDLIQTLIKCSPIKAKETMKLDSLATVTNGYTSVQLLGNLRFVARLPVGEITRVGQFQGTSLLLESAEFAPKDVPLQMQIPRFNYLSTKQCLERLTSMVNDLEKVVKGDIKRNHKIMISDIEKAGERLRIQIGQGNDDDIRQRLMMTQRLIFWMTRPYRSIVTHSMRSMRGAVTLCKLNQQ